MKTDEKQVRRALEHAEVRGAAVDRMQTALEAVLLFYSPAPWDLCKQNRWFQITGSREATTRVLCDHIRQVLGAAGGEA